MSDLDFQHIAPRLGGKTEAFEELCCQIARRTTDHNVIRLRGAGGDGGVECFADLPDGTRAGWQAKYIFDINRLLRKATASLETALQVHDSLTRYVLCFPFDPTGPTRRRGKSELEKLDDWKARAELEASKLGRNLTVEFWRADELRSRLLDIDRSGGIRAFFFNETILSPEWFEQHLKRAAKAAGPRYTPELNVKTQLHSWFDAFGLTDEWAEQFSRKLKACFRQRNRVTLALERTKEDGLVPAWPKSCRATAEEVVTELSQLLVTCEALISQPQAPTGLSVTGTLRDTICKLSTLEVDLAHELERKHGTGRADSPGFRQFMAEYQVSFPAANLDDTRELLAACMQLADWIESPEGALAFQKTFVLTGAWGSGKTHGVCDVAHQRLEEEKLSCVVFGHQFGGEPEMWSRLRECLGLPSSLGREALLDALNSTAEATGYPLIIFVDAINETRPLRYWADHLVPFAATVEQKPYLRVCFTCRSSYYDYCVPKHSQFATTEHRGFAGNERLACQSFFTYYGLRPPVVPLLQPELANPLYLRLVCETLKAKGLEQLPGGWLGLAPVIRAFLDEKEREFTREHETAAGGRIVSRCLTVLAQEAAETASSCIPWTRALELLADERAKAPNCQLLEWLVRTDLLAEDAPISGPALDAESSVRLAFERLGDFLIALQLLAGVVASPTAQHRSLQGTLGEYLAEMDWVSQNAGVVAALAILVPETVALGRELPDLLSQGVPRDAVLGICISSLPWRDPASFSVATRVLLREGLDSEGLAMNTMDAVLAVAWQPSKIDAFWVDELLRRIPLARRDAFWCSYLHQRYEEGGYVRRLIEAAFDMQLPDLDPEAAERWGTLLLWFTAAADRRVKDWATRAATAILVSHSKTVPAVLARFLTCDDDAVRERALLATYGALLMSHDAEASTEACRAASSEIISDADRNANALIRDHARCVCELAEQLDETPGNCDTKALRSPLGTDWPLVFPRDEEVAEWKTLPKLAHSCLADDFYIYSMGCLHPWLHAMEKKALGKWILGRVAGHFDYAGSGCERYDEYMLGKYGGGRGRITWAERIGKKYQWTALYQLGGIIRDHVKREVNSWTPQLLPHPLILLEERKLDPTLPAASIAVDEGHADPWWIAASADMARHIDLDDEQWVTKDDDLPALQALLAVQERDGQDWRILESFPSWDNRSAEARETADYSTPFRQVWLHIRAYLLADADLEEAYECLKERNFFGLWMPQGPSWLYGFAGEYPWGTAFNTEPESHYERGGDGLGLPVRLIPVSAELVAEWEYDASLPGSLHISLPARVLFKPGDLWWDGENGFRLVGGRTVFQDPSVLESGPQSLLVDSHDLVERLNRLGYRILWTLLGEKLILGGKQDASTPHSTFSQVAVLLPDGEVETSARVFFTDYDEATGPRT